MSDTVLGIIGGMGPFADSLFISLLSKYVVHNGLSGDSGYLPIILDGNCNRPDRSDFLTGKSKISPLPSLLTSLQNLKNCGAKVIAIPCNTSHAFFDSLALSKVSDGLTLINMPWECARAIAGKGIKKAGILATAGTVKSGIYDKYFNDFGISPIYPDEKEQREVAEIIRQVKNGGDGNIDRLSAVLFRNGAECVVTGCTELSVLLYRRVNAFGVYIDPLSVLAARSLNLCGKRAAFVPFT